MGKYEPLAEFLKDQPKDSVTASFRELEERLGFALPRSAREYRAWWSNQKAAGHSQKEGWQSAGWETREVDLAQGMVRFERVAPSAQSGSSLWDRAAQITGITDRPRLIEAALEALIEREAVKGLIALGGSDPNAWAPERRRFD